MAEGVALCRACERLSRLSEVVAFQHSGGDPLAEPPPGCSLVDFGQEVHVQVSTRSIALACFFIFFSLFWNGILSIFVLGVVGALYVYFFGELPHWFPGESPEIPGSIVVILGLALFLLPFIIAGIAVGWLALLCLFGRIDVHVGPYEASIRTGIGWLGRTKRFDPATVKHVALELHEGKEHAIRIEADRDITFGSQLTRERRDWLRAVLLRLLVHERDSRKPQYVARA